MRPLIVGDIVKTTREVLDNPAGSEGVVYENYDLGDGPAVSVIFENGEYDSFSPEEQEMFLKRVGNDLLLSEYKFKNVTQVSKDFNNGVFSVISR